MCPISCIEKIVQQDEARFNKTIRGEEGEAAAYWYGIRHHIIYKAIEVKVDPEHTLGLGLHGDGAPTNKTQSLFTIAWNSIHGRGTTRETRYVFTVVKKSDLVDGTLEALFDRLAWSMNALLEGRLPERDWRGQKLQQGGRQLATRGWKFACVQLRGNNVFL